MLGSLLLSSPADAEPEGPRELLAPATPVLAGRVGYSDRVGADQKKCRGQGGVVKEKQKNEQLLLRRSTNSTTGIDFLMVLRNSQMK